MQDAVPAVSAERGQRMFTLELAPRSMYVLAGEVRWQCQHGVPPTPGLRYSIAFRTLGPHARKAT